jgi:Swi5-dependent recombination DNA repair protein 1
MYPWKRRKLAADSSTLTKPFRSPLRVNANNVTAQPNVSNEQGSSSATRVASGLLAATSKADSTPNKHESISLPAPFMPNPLETMSMGVDALQKEYSTLARRLTSLRQSLDTAQQALRIETFTKPTGIDAQIAKWRSVVREAADELFEDAKQRVDREGGVKNWLLQQAKEPPDTWFEEQQIQLTETQKKMLEAQREDDQAEAEKYGLVDRKESEEPEDEGSTVSHGVSLFQLNPLMHPRRASPWTKCYST